MKFILATANMGKVREMRSVLSELGIDIVARDEVGVDIVVEETGSTFLENATLKAKAICDAAGLPAIADDSGLMVDALGGEPGVHSSSYGGEHLNSDERNAHLLDIMENVEQRSAKFVCTIVCAFPNGGTITSQGECLGEITRCPIGCGGFGYDPVFLPKGFQKTMAQLTPEEKNAISHRGKALRLLCSRIRDSKSHMDVWVERSGK